MARLQKLRENRSWSVIRTTNPSVRSRASARESGRRRNTGRSAGTTRCSWRSRRRGDLATKYLLPTAIPQRLTTSTESRKTLPSRRQRARSSTRLPSSGSYRRAAAAHMKFLAVARRARVTCPSALRPNAAATRTDNDRGDDHEAVQRAVAKALGRKRS